MSGATASIPAIQVGDKKEEHTHTHDHAHDTVDAGLKSLDHCESTVHMTNNTINSY